MDLLVKINSDHSLFYIGIRTVLIYIYAIFLFRIGNKRFNLGTAFDFIFVIITGAVLSRSINGNSTLLQAMLGSFILVFFHWVFAIISFHSSKFGNLVKGQSILIIENGALNKKNLQKNQITQHDLKETCRETMHHDDLSKIKEARLERTGKITFKK